MSRLNPFTTDRENRAPTIAAFLALAAVVGMIFVVAGPAGAATTEVKNTTVEVTNDTGEIYVTATFNDSITDANATADVVITDPNGTEFANTTISGNASEVVTEEWTINDSDPTGNYSAVVSTANSNVTDSVSVGTFVADSGGGGGSGGSDGGSVLGSLPMWLVVVVGLGVVVYGYSEGWLEDL